MFGSYYGVQGFGAAGIQSILGPHRLAARPMSPQEAQARAMAATVAKYQAVQQAARSGRPGAAGRLMGLSGFGATGLAFDAAGIWNDWAAGTNASTTRAAKQIQAALSQLGYTDKNNKPLVVDGKWGPNSTYAYTAFSAAQGTTTNGPNPTQDGIAKIGELLNAGVKPGPGVSVTYHDAGDGVLVPTAGGGAKAGLSTGMMIGIGAFAAIVLGGLALAGKKKAPEHHAGPSAVMVANRRRRARRHAWGF
jgi:hypothetical protein